MLPESFHMVIFTLITKPDKNISKKESYRPKSLTNRNRKVHQNNRQLKLATNRNDNILEQVRFIANN